MTKLHASKTAPYSCENMYNLVNDVASYPLFLPFCTKGEVHYQDNDEMQASIEVSVLGMTQTLTTRNFLKLHKMIEMRLQGGLFSHLEGFWRFEPTQEGSIVTFDIEFAFSNRMLSMFIDLESFMGKIITAFEKRAHEVYGEKVG
ncbi:MAG: hypothetical protein A3F18_03455 [Legionellales bacterium RIFCSPHIGHO2_12_FULL_37_14]|nr:MAG: hypothetical protein A3F18_03455 [Legionellales bacterium RIFCSPHIGHO2_12_FULL_37_14]